MSGPIRIGVVGLGMMGRHHVRITSHLEGFEFVGGVDPAGDVHRSLGELRHFSDLEHLLAEGVDACVVAVPSEDHEKVALRLAEAGVHTLIEKPIAHDLGSATRIRDAFAGTGLVSAVGHVERYNPALQEMKRRLQARALGRVFAISTRRVGPFPLRIQDVGVVKDLGTHDIDLILWLGGPVESISAQLAYRLGRPQEDLVEAVGRLWDGTVVAISVNWLTPTKERTVTVLGERGALVADLLAADLTFYANGDIPMEWDEMARLKGVSEGDMVRYALRKPEPLQTELECFRDEITGTRSECIVTLDEAVEVIGLAERILGGGDA